MTFFKWSRTADNNSNADSTINYAEGMPPSAVNDSGRAAMAASAKYRDDISGAIVTGGTSTSYTVTSYQVFDSFAHMSGNMIAFTPHATNGDTVTLNVDGLGAKPLRFSPSVEIPSNSLILGTPYVALYNTTDSAFYLHGGFTNPYSVPLAAGMDYWGSTAPNSAFVFPIGQAISRTTYATLFAKISTTYGTGDGSTTFNLPDKTGSVSAMKESVVDGSRRLNTTYFGDSTTLGTRGGSQSHAITQGELPAVAPTTSSVTINTSGLTASITTTRQFANTGSSVTGSVQNGSNAATTDNNISLAVAGTATGTVTMNALGSGTAHTSVQSTIICNYIMRVL